MYLTSSSSNGESITHDCHHPLHETSAYKLSCKGRILIPVVVLLVVNAFITQSFFLSTLSHIADEDEIILDDIRPIEKWKWIEAHQDCPIIGIREFQHIFPKKATVTTGETLSLVIAVMASSATKERMIAQLQGWASSLKNVFLSADIFFSVDKYVPEIPKDLMWIASDERARPPTRVGAQWRSLHSLNESVHRAPTADWIFLVDDDTFVNTFALKDFLYTLNPEVPAIYGYMFWRAKWNRDNCWISGGAGMLLQREAAVRVVPHIEACFDRLNDETISCAAKRAGIPLVHSELFSPDDNSKHDNHIGVYTMVTWHYINPRQQVGMFADLASYHISSGSHLDNVKP
ncbi:hypothetical protein ACHAWX_000503 [Stephanocyclus meneghinianus]